jgi:Mycothiol maleylpyruvate isomerase N-terminal domain
VTVDIEALMESEDTGWNDLCRVIARFSTEQTERPGVTPEGWSVKDVMFHIAGWAADCGVQLERIRMGTFTRPDEDVETQNRQWFERSRTMDLGVVRSEFAAARTRMVEELARLPEITPDAVEWFEESGALHYAEHLASLRAWAAELLV